MNYLVGTTNIPKLHIVGLDKKPKKGQPGSMPGPESIGAAMRELRGKVPQTELAAAIDAAQSDISKWENGKEPPSVDEIYRFERFLGLTPGVVLAAAGYADVTAATALAIETDTTLNERGRDLMRGAYEGAQLLSRGKASRTPSKSGTR